MEMNWALLVLFVLGISVTNGQRVAPGVPPQQYQQPPHQYQQQPPQQQQQPPQHQQQPYQQYPQQNLPPGVNPEQYHQQQQQQVQYQQVPVQQQPPAQQVPGQQVPQGHFAGHHHHGQQQVLNAANVQHEREHIQEHMQVPIDTSKMSEAELQFHYFKMHDSDNNNKLDGCELIKSLIHWHVKDGEAATEDAVGKTFSDEQLSEAADHILKAMDSNNDGYVDYTEYRKSEESH